MRKPVAELILKLTETELGAARAVGAPGAGGTAGAAYVLNAA